jgi:hypothetical protein
MGRPSVEALSVMPAKDRACRPLADGEIDLACGPGNERDDRRLVALPHDAQSAVAPLEAEVLDVARARLAHRQSVEPEEHSQGGANGPTSADSGLPTSPTPACVGSLRVSDIVRCFPGMVLSAMGTPRRS